MGGIRKVLFIDDPVTVSSFRDIGQLVRKDILFQELEGESGLRLNGEDIVRAIDRYDPDLIILEPYYVRGTTDLHATLKTSKKPYILFTTQSFSGRLVPFPRRGWSRWGFTEKNLQGVQVIAKPASAVELFEAIKQVLG